MTRRDLRINLLFNYFLEDYYELYEGGIQTKV